MQLKTKLMLAALQTAANDLANASQLFEALWLWEHNLADAVAVCRSLGLPTDSADACQRIVTEIRDQQIALRTAMTQRQKD